MSDSDKAGFLSGFFKKKAGSATRQRGLAAERIAAEHLAGHGYKIIRRNFECAIGEIDIVALEGEYLVFIEVRSRHSAEGLSPAFSVNKRKQRKIAQVAEIFLEKYYSEIPPCRFDVVLVTLGPPPEVEVIRDAFGSDPF